VTTTRSRKRSRKASAAPLLTSSGGRARDARALPRRTEEILEVFGKHIDCVIDAEQTPAEPSTVLEVNGEEITLIREGQGSIEGILDLVQLPEPRPPPSRRSTAPRGADQRQTT